MSREVRRSLASPTQTGSPRFNSIFSKISHVEYLNYDERPSFVLDLDAYGRGDTASPTLAFCNPALLSSLELHRIVCRTFTSATSPKSDEEDAFTTWIARRYPSPVLHSSKLFFDTIWTVTPMPENWAVISGIPFSRCDLKAFNGNAESYTTFQQQNDILLDPSSQDSAVQAETAPAQIKASQPPEAPQATVWPPIGLGDSDHIKWIRDFDWASTSLGPTDTWPARLRQACEIMLADPDPVTVFWGPDLILIYNEAYIALAGNKHPAMMGGSARVHWKEVWDQYDSLFDQIRIDGQAFKQDNIQLFIHRRGFLEEGFFNLRVLPVFDADGSVVGFYEPVSEMTKQTLSERRMHTLMKLSEHTSSVTSLKILWDSLLEALKEHRSDVHFALLYHLQDESRPDSNPQYDLGGAVGLDPDAGSFPPTLNIHEPEDDGIINSLRRAHANVASVLLSSSDGSLSPTILTQLKTAGVVQMPNECIIYPLSSSVDDNVEAFLILGISPTRLYDEDYELFINLLARQVDSTITFVKLFEKEKQRLRQQAVYESELKFKKFAENAQVGIFSFDPVGNIMFCNESWLELTGHDRNDMSAMSWTEDVHPENIAEIKGYWDKIANLEGPQTFEVQYKKPWKPAHVSGESISLDRTWVVASAYAEVSDKGELTGIIGSVTDISTWKWVDQLQSRRLSEALELKRQQENFLDITSHEMRNPLNAILHCAAELIELLSALSESAATNEQAAVLADCQDASRTIVYCGRHQKRIIDDVLTLSKLDSNLLSITPEETQPLDVVEEVLKVFDTEIRASSIQTRIELTDSYKALMIDTVLIDPHRVIQILINLVANAIKFTKGESLRSLHVAISAHTTEPAGSDAGVRYVPSGRRPADPTTQAEWGSGDIIFLHFSVQDTGPGMTRNEADLLFNRFAQGSPRTHVQYGGSGLGLFISRELAELHGGRIGISSEPGYGSTFDFYIKGRRPAVKETAKSPSDTVNDQPHAPSLAPNSRTEGSSRPPTAQSLTPLRRGLRKISGKSGLHVLIIEDNLINQKILAKLIRKNGHTVSVANHGEEALAILKTSTWSKNPSPVAFELAPKLDIILADIEMPIMDGKEFVRQVRRWQSDGILTSDIPVIAVTGNARNELIQQAKECGFNEVVSKPYREEDILSMIEEYTNSGDKC